MGTQAASYLRLSGVGQVEGHGFTRQREAIARYAKANGVNVVAEYRDLGVSGTKELADREGLAALIDRVESNGVRLVLVEAAHRLARDLMVSELILGQFRELGVKVVAADSGTDLTVSDHDPTRKLIRQVLSAVSEFEKSTLVAKLRAARDRKRRQTGRCEGRKPFGHHASERPVVERILALRRKPKGRPRLSYAAIAEALNQDEVPTRTGRPWAAETIRGIVERSKNRA